MNKMFLQNLSLTKETSVLQPKAVEAPKPKPKFKGPKKKIIDEDAEPMERRTSGRLSKKPPEFEGLQGSDEELELDDEGRAISTGRKSNKTVRRVGSRVYDPINGTSCHQCRQKTMDPKIRCTNTLPNGELCGIMICERDLKGRYGEELEEALKSGEWICPVCSGSCNCS